MNKIAISIFVVAALTITFS